VWKYSVLPACVLLDCAYYNEPQTRSCGVNGSENMAPLVGLFLSSFGLEI
jgi:hypothetical protein